MNQSLSIMLLSGICLISCTEKKASTLDSTENLTFISLDIPDTCVRKSDLFYNTKKSLWILDSHVYSGYAVSFHPDSTLKEKFGILHGKKQNNAIHWYPDGHYRQVSNYHYGKLHGHKKTWSNDSTHILLSHLQYSGGKLHGEQNKWYPTGELFKKLNFNMGKEEGLQSAFRRNGAVFANYEARNGRIFGLKKATLCYGLEEERFRMRIE